MLKPNTLHADLKFYLRKEEVGPGEVAQQLGTLAVLAEVTDFLPSTHVRRLCL